jgi:hypothetical protein
MPTRPFQPGVRFSVVDGIVIVIGAVAAIAVWPTAGWITFIIAFVVAHFFLFCNVFRVSRPLELAWSGLFIVLTYCTIRFGQPPWLVSIAISLLATVIVVALEMRRPSYHGLLWKMVNPKLPQWWAERALDE